MLRTPIVVFAFAAGISPLAAQTVQVPRGKTAIEVSHSGQCLKATRKGRSGFFARQGDCSGGNHEWTLSAHGGAHRIETRGLCLDAPDGWLPPTKLATCKDDQGQLWRFEAIGGSGDGAKWFLIRNAGNKKCLEVTKARKVRGAKVAANECDSSRSQQRWRFAPPGGSNDVKPAKPSAARWSGSIDLGLVAASAALDPQTMKLRLWSGYTRNYFGGTKTYWTTFDWRSGSVGAIGVAKTGEVFCQGSALDRNGVLVVAGGTTSGKTFTWAGDAAFATEADLKIRRGYNTLTSLANGDLFTFGGSWSGDEKSDKKGEIWRNGSWSTLSGLSTRAFRTADAVSARQDQHMWLFATGGSHVFHAGPSKNMHWIDTSGNGGFQSAGTRGGDPDSMSGNAVMYEPDKILTIGGSPSYVKSKATSHAHVIDLSAGVGAKAKVRRIADMKHARAFHNSVLLPDGNVVIVGGQRYALPFVDVGSVSQAELFDAETETFVELPAMKTQRNYHSIAILLPDGRVFAAGGGLCGIACKANHANAEILSPAYLFDAEGREAPRPRLSGVARRAAPGSEIRVTSDATEFALVRMSSTTHTINTDQRRFVLKDREAPGDNDDVILTLPTAKDGFVPGAYMLFGLNDAGTPSIAQSIIVN